MMDNDLIEFMTSCCTECGIDMDPDDPPEPTDHEHRVLLTMQDFHWEICPRCRGEGILKGYAGVYTSDDFDSGEMDYVDYMMNRRACEDCGCLGRVQMLNLEAESRLEVQAVLLEHYECEHISAMERARGA